MEITNQPSNKRAGSYHRERGGTHQPVLKNVTELTRHNLSKPTKQDPAYKQQDALSLVGSQKQNGHPMMLSKKQNQSSKSFAQTYQRQRVDYKPNNEATSAGLAPTEQNEATSNQWETGAPNSQQVKGESSKGLYTVTQHNTGLVMGRDRSSTDSSVKHKLSVLASSQT